MIRLLSLLVFWFAFQEPVLVDFGVCLPFEQTIIVDGTPVVSQTECVAEVRNNVIGFMKIGTRITFLNDTHYGLGGSAMELEGWITGYQFVWTLEGIEEYYIIRYFNQTGTTPLMKEFALLCNKVSNL